MLVGASPRKRMPRLGGWLEARGYGRAVHTQLHEAESLYVKWEFDVRSTPKGQEMYDHLYEHAPVEWNRFQIFQDVRC